MPTLTADVTATTTATIKLAPQVRKRLMLRLRTYAGLKGQLDALKLAMDKEKGLIDEIRAETGEQSIKLEGYSITLVAPIRSIFDKKKFVSLGGELELYNQAHVNVPGKAYAKISVPGSREHDDE